MYNGGSEERELFKVKGAVYKTVSKVFMERYKDINKTDCYVPHPQPKCEVGQY